MLAAQAVDMYKTFSFLVSTASGTVTKTMEIRDIFKNIYYFQNKDFEKK